MKHNLGLPSNCSDCCMRLYHGSVPWDNSQFASLSWPLNQFTMEKIIPLIMTGFLILLPEIYIYISAWQRVEAKEFRDEVQSSHPPFTLREAFFVCLGGYRVSIPPKHRYTSILKYKANPVLDWTWCTRLASRRDNGWQPENSSRLCLYRPSPCA